MTVHRATRSLTARSGQPRRRWTLLSAIAGVTSVSTLVLTVAVGVTPAFAAGTGLFSQSFSTSTVNPANGPVALPSAPSGTNVACLTVLGSTGVLPSCGTNDTSGSGSLRLTNDNGGGSGTEGGVFSATSVPASQGLDVTFNSYQFAGTGADGIAFVLSAVNPSNPLSPPTIGQSGGSLGYSAQGGGAGLATGYLGFGFDTFGNFSNTTYQGTGCPAAPAGFSASAKANQVAIRGPGNGNVGYCGLNSTNASGQHLDAPGSGTKAQSLIPVEVVINPTASAFTATTAAVSVPAGTYAVIFTLIGGSQQTLSGALPSVSPTFYGASTSGWLDGNGIPKQLAFGWVASTGGSDDNHNIDNVVVTSIQAVPKLDLTQTIQDVSTTNGLPTTVPQGSPVSYVATPTVDASGADETHPITVTDTLPAGVTPTSAGGNGWVCQPPSGQQVTCTNSNGPFAAGTTLPPLHVNGTVTDPSGVAESTIETNTVTTASSSDALPSYSTAAAPATPGTAPSALVIAPVAGVAGSSATISGTAIATTSQIQIGTSAELLAGTAPSLGMCPTLTPAPGCFTYDGTNLQISVLPAHAVGATLVQLVASGTSAQVAFSYIAVPATSTAVVATTTTGTYTSASVTWTPGSNNGSAVTLWTVTPFAGSVAGTPWTSANPAATSATVAGLTNGQTYTFQVVATNVAGGSTPAVSNSLILPASLAVTTSSLSAGEVSVAAYSQTLVSTGGTLPKTWSLTAGSLPTGLTLSALGVISGTPSAANNGSVGFTVTVTDANSVTSFRAESIVIAALPVVTTATLASVQVSSAGYSQTLAKSGGTGPFNWTVTGGALPTGLSLAASTGIISGTPTANGTFGFTVTVTDVNAKTSSAPLTIWVSTPAASAPAAPAGATVTDSASGTSPSVTAGALSASGMGSGALRVSSLVGAPSGVDATAPAVTGATGGGFYNVAVAPGASLTELTVSFTNTPSSSIYWWNGTTWVKIPGTTRDPVTGELVAHLTATSTPSLSQLANATFAAGATPVTRIGGADRTATSIAASMAEFPGLHSAAAVVLARSDVFADALTGGPLAAAENAPVLLTAPNALSAATAAEISRVLAVGGTVYLLGGDSALSVAVEQAVTAPGYRAVRISGADRFATSVQIAQFLGNPSTVFEVSGLNFPDAMSAGSAAIAMHGAILLTNGSTQAASTSEWLAAHKTAARYAVGGPAASADHGATSLSGADRYATATAVAAKFFAKPVAVGFATGGDFADALAAAPMLGTAGSPLLLVSPASTLPTSVSTYLSANADTIASATVYGGTSAVSDALVQQVQRYTP